MLRLLKLLSVVLVLSVSALPAFADDVVIPNVNKEERGPSAQAYPFHRGNMRYQQVYAKDQFQGLTGIIESFTYRPDEVWGKPFNTDGIRTQIWFSHTDAGPNTLSDTFDDNMGKDKTLVFDGDLALSSDGSGVFDTVIDVDDVFKYDGQENLIMEIKVLGAVRTTYYDAAGTGYGQGGTDWTGRLWATDPNAPTGSQAGDDGPVTQFTLGGGDTCSYTLKKSKSKGGCNSCPKTGSKYASEQGCEIKKDCRKKVKTTITCPQGNGKCKLTAKKRKCG